MMRTLFLAVGVSLVVGLCGCRRSAILTAPSPTTPPFTPPASTVDAPTAEGAASGLCDRWVAQPLDLGALPLAASMTTVSAESDGRGGVTILARQQDASAVGLAIASDGHVDGSITILPPGSDPAHDPVTLSHLQAAPQGSWVGWWSGGTSPGLYRYDATSDATLIEDAADPAYAGAATSFGVSEDGFVGVEDAMGVHWRSLAGGSPWLVSRESLTQWTTSSWCDGQLVFAAGYPSPEIGAIDRDGMFALAPAPAPLRTANLATTVGAEGGFAAFFHQGDGTYAVPGAPIHVTFTTPDVEARAYVLDLPIDVWGGAMSRVASQGALVAWADRGATGAGGSPMQLVELAPNGSRSRVQTLGLAPVAPTHIVTAATSDGDLVVVIEWNGSVRNGWTARCVDGGV